MHRFSLPAALLSVLLIANTVFAETTQVVLNRNSQSQLSLNASLTKDVYRQEPHQVPYTVQEPYETTETYYVDVPYQHQEFYTDYEDYWDQEYRCHTRTRHERVCRDKEDCHIVPGNGPGGGPRRECTRVPVCETVPRTERECHWEQVRKTRPVTKSRWVTRYRQEARTRTVTRYRDKEVCCKTVYRDVFDHTYTVPVTVNFPAETQLTGQEKETFQIVLSGTEANPQVSFTVKQSIFGYQVDSQENHGGGIIITLKAVPLYSVEQLGRVSIKGLALEETINGSIIRFVDQGLKPRVLSRYAYQIREVGSNELIVAGELAASLEQVEIRLDQALEDNKEYQLDLRLQRQGLPLSGTVDEFLSAIKKVTPLKNAELHMRKDQINTFEIRGETTDAKLLFRDQSPADEGVHTIYKIEILIGDANGTVVATKEFLRESAPMATKGFFKIHLAQDLGVPTSILNEKVRHRKLVTARVTTTRTNPRLNQGVPVVLKHVHVQEIVR
ncbi:hypothetical protein [Bdellovibrio reynosensis]|uniref:Bdellovibrio beta-sandwich domain-containing protein n=1 Tax=Bdellovibrio reynosensis TaxID=2835041 RepID=A0ABY4CA27_9BACT|nr:hypothetical protein [Bdellovibrio reynosensis]UOF01334.1 hypothetical protein MNR06_16695 [Bdellovibrio reynosensis]